MKLFSISATLLLLLVSPTWAVDSWTEEMRRATQPCPFEPFKEMLSTPRETNWVCSRTQIDADCSKQTIDEIIRLEVRAACAMKAYDIIHKVAEEKIREGEAVLIEGTTCSGAKDALRQLNVAKDTEISYANLLKPDADLTWLPTLTSIVKKEIEPPRKFRRPVSLSHAARHDRLSSS